MRNYVRSGHGELVNQSQDPSGRQGPGDFGRTGVDQFSRDVLRVFGHDCDFGLWKIDTLPPWLPMGPLAADRQASGTAAG